MQEIPEKYQYLKDVFDDPMFKEEKPQIEEFAKKYGCDLGHLTDEQMSLLNSRLERLMSNNAVISVT
ncbi:MAG TPA: hypothetical protein PK344_15305 [Syntrophorhabdaceae bacterium]|jgi:hypothetical protein|nr:hypothetical protein [Syntrophorhabdaceae bacterium]